MKTGRLLILFLLNFTSLVSCSSSKNIEFSSENLLVKENIVSITIKDDDYLGSKVNILEEENINNIVNKILEITKESNFNSKQTEYINKKTNVNLVASLAFETQIYVVSKENKMNFYTYSNDLYFYEVLNEKYVAFNGDIESYSYINGFLGGEYE